MDDRHVLDDGADELHDAKEDEQLSVDNELFLFECVWQSVHYTHGSYCVI
jgi:hypothetical protein